MIYFDSFGVEYVPKEKTNIFRIQDYKSVICGHFCILFIECMLKNKTLTDFTNLFSANDLKIMMK